MLRNCLAVLFFLALQLQAQHHERALAAHVVVPQSRSFAMDYSVAVQITEVEVSVVILDQAASTTMDISLANPGPSRLEAELIVPVPLASVVKGFTFQGAAPEATAELLPRERAHEIYDAIVARVRDPALLEFIGYNLIRSSVFPVEARGTQKVRLSYEHLLPADGNRVDYVLPRTESLQYNVPWQISLKIQSKKPISTVYSPSHGVEATRISQNVVSVRLKADARTEPGPFLMSYLLEENGVSASLFTYPDPGINGGYFLLLAGLPAVESKSRTAIKREVTLVLDRSGSMRGEKIRQVREAALQILGGLEHGETFNIIVYNQVVESFSPVPVTKDAAAMRQAEVYLNSITPLGGTNIHDSLVEALRMKPTAAALPIVLFLTDGLPTIGQTSEVSIRNVAQANPYQKRVFTFGVGVDVNTPLLEKIASETRATATFVLPQEDVELKVAQVFKRLSGPVLAGPHLGIVNSSGNPVPGRVHDVLPTVLPDLFDGDQLVLLGCYIEEKPVTFELSGNYLGTQRKFRYTFDLEKATTRNAFVPRLWASRKIATLIDAIRQLGADSSPLSAPGRADDQRLKELIDEVVRLSKEFGILTEYTAFLAREGTDLSYEEVLSEAERNFKNRALYDRSGLSSVNQDINTQEQKVQSQLNRRNEYWDQTMNRVDTAAVQQVNDRAFYQRDGRWVDSRILDQEAKVKPKKVIVFGSEEFCKLALRLADEGRQGCISLNGDVLLVVDGEAILIQGPSHQ